MRGLRSRLRGVEQRLWMEILALQVRMAPILEMWSSSGGTAESTFTIENSGDKPLNLTTDPRVVISGGGCERVLRVTTDASRRGD